MQTKIMVKKNLYIKTPKPGTSLYVKSMYTGNGMCRMEESVTEETSDVYYNKKVRFSSDNSRTFAEWKLSEDRNEIIGNYHVFKFEMARAYDPVSKKMVRTMMYRIVLNEPTDTGIHATDSTGYYDQMFYQVSEDDGMKWSDIIHLRHEDGPCLHLENMYNAQNLIKNRMYGGYNMISLEDGCMLYCGTVPTVIKNQDNIDEKVDGNIVLKGRWNAKSNKYDWVTSVPVAVSKQISSRGLMEPFLAELSDGRIMIEMRGSNTDITPGRKWICLSEDGGITWGKIIDLRYETGEQFFAPSALAKIIRSSKTNKLYWIGNICSDPPTNNLPRYPLYIAEIDESIPALVKESLTVIDNYDPEKDTPLLQLSNFCLLENRETMEIELYMTRLGERGDGRSYKGDFWTSDTYKYVITL